MKLIRPAVISLLVLVLLSSQAFAVNAPRSASTSLPQSSAMLVKGLPALAKPNI